MSRDQSLKLVTSEEMHRIEARLAEDGLPASILMELAGRAVAEEVKPLVGDGQVLVLVGPGNNGGDGLVAARHLWLEQIDVAVACFPLRSEDDDANFRIVKRLGISCFDGFDSSRLEILVPRTGVVIDALFGTGRLRPFDGAMEAALLSIRDQLTGLVSVVSIDVPSGLDADTGRLQPNTVWPNLTLALGFPKVGLYASPFPGVPFAHEVRVLDIGIPPWYADSVHTELMTFQMAYGLLPQRSPNSNKGTFGRVLVVGGSPNYIGAVALAAQGAGRSGAGLVTIATAKALQPIIASKVSEATFLPLPEAEPGVLGSEAVGSVLKALDGYRALLIGPGLGQDSATATFVRSQLDRWPEGVPIVVDADGLNILAEEPRWFERWTGDGVLTPHPGEMARLMRMSVEDVQANRLGVAREAAASWNKTVVLKGAYTVVAAPSGEARVSPVATAALATAGTGDVLAGAIAGLLAQGLSPFNAASLGVWLHGRAGEMLAAEVGEAGVLAGDLLPRLPIAMNEVRQWSY